MVFFGNKPIKHWSFPAMSMLLAMLLTGGQAYMLGSDFTDPPAEIKVKTYEGALICTITVADGGGHGNLSAGECKALGAFATAVRVTGNYAQQHYLDAAGNEVATGKEGEDGYWLFLSDGKRYQLSSG
jgi:hypothetical protein